MRPRRKPEERFWKYVNKESGHFWEDTECWEWTGGLSGGYGSFYDGTEMVTAHSFGYRLLVGPLEPGMVPDHLCRNRACVFPGHLEAVTGAVNTLRGESFAARNARKTHCPQGHPYDAANTKIGNNGGRYCRACQRQRNKEYRRRKREAAQRANALAA